LKVWASNSLGLQQPSPIYPRIPDSQGKREERKRSAQGDEKSQLICNGYSDHREKNDREGESNDVTVGDPSENGKSSQHVKGAKKKQQIQARVFPFGERRQNEN